MSAGEKVQMRESPTKCVRLGRYRYDDSQYWVIHRKATEDMTMLHFNKLTDHRCALWQW